MGAEVSMLITLVTAVSISITQPAIVDAALSILASELISLEKDFKAFGLTTVSL